MAATVGALSAVPEAAVAVPVDDGGRRQWVHSAWRPAVAAPAVAEAWRRGERSLHRAVGGLVVLDVPGLDGTALLDADRPEDLPGDG
jgi:molybdopterin-guanine dinucleotide biosynthesis protein A